MLEPVEPKPGDARQHALKMLITSFIAQGHPPEYAQHMATTAILQADLELRNAQLARLLGWLKQEHCDIYEESVATVESIREEFERRV